MKTQHIASFAIASVVLALFNPISPAAATTPIPGTEGLTELQQVVVPPSGSKTILLPELPANAVAVKIGLQTSGAWRYTKVEAYIGSNGVKKTVAEPINDSKQVQTATLVVPAKSNKTLTFTSSQASVRIKSAVISYELSGAKSPISGAEGLPELESFVIAPGRTKTIALDGLPSNAVSVKLIVQTAGAWRYTKLTASVGQNGKQKTIAEPSNDSKKIQTVTLLFPAKSAKTITFTNTQASVSVRTAVVSYGNASANPVVPAPIVATPAPSTPDSETPDSTTPDSTNTGVPEGTKLAVHNGDLIINEAGTVIDGKDVRGKVKINAANVTIKNSIIRGKSDTTLLVNNLQGHSGLKIIDSEIFASTESPNSQGIYGYNFALTRVDIHNVIDGVHITGSNVTVKDSWIHDNLHYVNDPNFNGSPSHDDSIQIQVGNNIMITGNTLSGPYNANTQITQDRGVVSNVTFTENNFSGGKCSINIAEKAYGPLKGIIIKDNKFARDTTLANCAVISKTTTIIDHADNFYTDGTKVSIRRG